MAERHLCVIDELVVDAVRNSSTQAKGNDEAGGGNRHAGYHAFANNAQVNLETDEKEKEDQAKVGDEVETGN